MRLFQELSHKVPIAKCSNSFPRFLWIIVAVFTFACWNSASAQTPDLRIFIFSVGQTDSQLIIGPKKTLLIDIGAEVAGPKKQYEYVADKIKEITGGGRIDYFLISHYHTDHMGNLYHNSTKGNGLWGLLNEQGISVDTVIDRGDETPWGERTKSHQNYMTAISQWKTDGKVASRVTATLGSTQIALGGNVVVEVVSVNGNGVLQIRDSEDPERFLNYPPSENDYSVGLKISLGKFEYFTGGDLSGQDAERSFPEGAAVSYNDIETTVARLVGDVEIVRANHHGSGHSSNHFFVSHLDPESTIISCGRNTYHHPDRAAFDRLHSTGKVIITTDVSEQEWQGDESIDEHIVGHDLTILVLDGGNTYKIDEVVAAAFTDEEEAADLDARNSYPFVGGTVVTSQTIPWSDAPNYVNQNVIVEGKIIKVKKLQTVAFLNFSPLYWRDLTGVIFSSDFPNFPNLVSTYSQKKVRIKGKITEYEGRPQIIIKNRNQITIQP